MRFLLVFVIISVSLIKYDGKYVTFLTEFNFEILMGEGEQPAKPNSSNETISMVIT